VSIVGVFVYHRFPLIQASTVYSSELTSQDKSLAFITDVVHLDMTKYDAKLKDYTIEADVAQEGIT